MEQNYMLQTSDEFFRALDGAHQTLEDFSQQLGEKNSAIFAALSKFAQDSQNFQAEGKGDKADNEVDKLLEASLNNIKMAIQQWYDTIEKSKQGQKFMRDHEKYVVVMVFGAVKTGKSTLGNFLAGREWLKAPFDNEYKHRPPTQFATQEKGRETGDIENIDGRYWFSEGVTDTTGDIQYFTLSGLRWFDSPGTGALGKEGDKRNMEEMVKEYLPYVDICIFLTNSSEPGLMEDMKYIEFLNRTEQEALVVITKSDKVEEDVDENGNLVKVFCAKPASQRQQQEEDMLKRLADAYPNLDANKYRAMSLSSYLAQMGLEKNDEQLFRASHVDLLMQKIRNKAASDVISLKMKRPQKAMNIFLQSIIEGDEEVAGINKLSENLGKVTAEVENYQQKISSRTERMVNRISRQIRSQAQNALTRMAHETEQSGTSYSGDSIAKMMFDIAQPIITKEIQTEVSKILNRSGAVLQDLKVEVTQPAIQTSGIQRQTKTFTTKHTYYTTEERDPDGLWETIRSIFGKQYYESVAHTETLTHTYNAGTNADAVIGQLMPQLEAYAERMVRGNFEQIAENYFLPQQKYVEQMQKELSQLKQQLNALRF